MKYNIGITCKVPTSLSDLYFDSHTQYTLYLHHVLTCMSDVNVYLIVDKPMIENPLINSTHRIVIYNSEEYVSMKRTLHLIIQASLQLSKFDLTLFKEYGTKRVLVHTQNEYMIELEENLFSNRESVYPQYALFKTECMFSEVWITPDIEHANLEYMKTRYRCPVKIVPLLWSPKLIERLALSFPNKGLYVPKKDKETKIAIVDSNIHFGEYCLPSLFVCESAYRSLTDKQEIKKVMVINSQPMNTKQFSRFTYSLDLYQDKKLSVENTFNTIEVLSKYADIAVSHQWDVLFKPHYLEMAWFGWPFVHDSPLLKNIGYYYDKFEYKHGGKVLTYVLHAHDKVYLNYFIKNRRLIQESFSIDNTTIQEKYRDFVLQLLQH